MRGDSVTVTPERESVGSDTGRRSWRFGPGLLVTAAFIGPGTVVTASRAGAEFGCQLLWVIVFSCAGTIILQSLAARLGIVGQMGLGESIRTRLDQSRWLVPAIALVVAALGGGNAAYQTGNLTGAVVGIVSVLGGDANIWLLVMMIVAGALVSVGRYRLLHHVLVSLVVFLSVTFLAAGWIAMPSADQLLAGTFVPRLDRTSLTLVIALIGTTIVPYNLFLHASGAAATWRASDRASAFRQSDWDTIIAVALGGLVTASILITANATFFECGVSWTGIEQISEQLRTPLGAASGICFALGLFAAGLTSALTAPLATAYAICGCMGWKADPTSAIFRSIAIAVIAVGGTVAMVFGKSPAATIQFAQVANGLLLPVTALFLLLLVRGMRKNQPLLMGPVRTMLAYFVVCLVSLLGLWRIAGVLF